MKLINERIVLMVALLVVAVRSGTVNETTMENRINVGSGITGFLSKLRQNVETGAQQVKETVREGYNFVKQKLSMTSDETAGTIAPNKTDEINENAKVEEIIPTTEHVENIRNDVNIKDKNDVKSENEEQSDDGIINNDRIIFEDDAHGSLDYRNAFPTLNASGVLARPILIETSNKTGNVSIGDRNALTAPKICPSGQRLVDDKCVAIINMDF